LFIKIKVFFLKV